MNPNKTVRPWILACGKQYGINHAFEYIWSDVSSRQVEMYCTYQFIDGEPTQVGQEDFSAAITSDDQRARGTMTIAGLPVADETFVIGSTTITAKVDGSGDDDHFTIGADAAATVANINTTLKECSEKANINTWDGAGNTVIVEWLVPGVIGNEVPFSETMTNCSMDGSGFLGGTHAGVASHDIERRGVQQHEQRVQIDLYNSENGLYELEAFGVAAHHSPAIRDIFRADNASAFGHVVNVVNMTTFDNDADVRFHHRMICAFVENVDISLTEIDAIVDSILTDITITHPA